MAYNDEEEDLLGGDLVSDRLFNSKNCFHPYGLFISLFLRQQQWLMMTKKRHLKIMIW